MRTYFPRSWDRDQCDACQTAASAKDPLRAVLAALPDKLVLACGGGVPPAVVDLVRDELQRHSAARIAARVERRWWQSWAGRPLRRDGDAHRDGYGPDDVAVWLLTPTACNGRCEDGWLLAPPERPDRDDEPCPVCRGGWLLSARREESDADDDVAEPKPAAARSLADAVSSARSRSAPAAAAPADGPSLPRTPSAPNASTGPGASAGAVAATPAGLPVLPVPRAERYEVSCPA
ncbi:hypothetical protein SRIMM317S_07414 [Streptomyces rimosus subsp. rimosus]